MKKALIALSIATMFVSGISFAGDNAMKVKYLGHAAFELTTAAGKRIVFDPYTAGAFGSLNYGAIAGSFDVAITSHDHEDHTCKDVLSRSKNVVKKTGKAVFDGITVESFATYHDEAKGSKRGKNLISIVTSDGLRVAHLGDLGHPITAKEFPALKGVDVLLIPVGGYFTIDAPTAAKIVKEFAPRIAIPMHFKTAKVDLPISAVGDFAKLMERVETPGASEVEISKETLPAETTVIVLDPAN